jgi:dolichol-phosphate mannosyltransferase
MIDNEPVVIASLQLLSVVIPARNEEGSVLTTVDNLHGELTAQQIPHEIIVVDDGSSDRTWQLLQERSVTLAELKTVRNEGQHGFGRAVITGLDAMSGDAVVIVMADGSDDCRDVVRYWQELNKGYDCVFGSRFIKGGSVQDYPLVKLLLNRFANIFLMVLFQIPLNLTVELPLKAIVRGFSWTKMPVSWRNRLSGQAKFKIKEMGSRYLFICIYIWLEKYLSRGDYRKNCVSEKGATCKDLNEP